MRRQHLRTMTVSCAALSLVLLAAPALSQRRGSRGSVPGGFAEGRLMKKHAKEIGLSEETLKKIDAAIEAGTAEETKLRDESTAAIDEMHKLLEESRPSQKELLAAAAKVGEIATKSRNLKVKSVVEMRALLTDEELAKFMEIRRKVAARR